MSRNSQTPEKDHINVYNLSYIKTYQSIDHYEYNTRPPKNPEMIEAHYMSRQVQEISSRAAKLEGVRQEAQRT